MGNIKVYKQQALEQFEQSDENVDAYVLHLLGMGELNDTQQKMFDKLEFAATLAKGANQDNLVVNAIAKGSQRMGIEPCSKSHARKIFLMMKQVWGDVMETKSRFEKWAHVQFFKAIAKAAKDDGDWSNAIRAMKEAGLLQGLYDKEESGVDPNTFLPDQMWILPDSNEAIIYEEEEQGEEEEDINDLLDTAENWEDEDE